LGFRSGGRERAVEQTVHGGSDGWMRHRASGSAPEQPVPRKMSDDDDDDDGEATAAEAPVGRVGAGPESIDRWTDSWLFCWDWEHELDFRERF
jgi:hypothetical protein